MFIFNILILGSRKFKYVENNKYKWVLIMSKYGKFLFTSSMEKYTLFRSTETDKVRAFVTFVAENLKQGFSQILFSSANI